MSTNESSQVVADLKAARDELVSRGRCGGELVRHDGAVCARGAIATAVIDGFDELYLRGGLEWASAMWQQPRFLRTEKALVRHLPAEFAWVWEFNDDPNTTDEDVLNLFSKALADLGGLA